MVLGATVEELGFDHRVTAGAVYELLRDGRTVLPMTAEYALAELSVGWRPGTPDNAPILGHCDLAGLVLATGHYRNGVLLTPITADVISQLITSGELDSVAAPFSLDRFVLTGGAGPMIIHVNGQAREIAPPVRLTEVLDLPEGASTRRGIAVAVNGKVIPRSQHASTELADGARVEIVTAVQGG